MIKFSIIIPSFNSSAYILKTLGSIKNQTYKDFEIIITDDGSTDNTVAVVEAFKKDNPDLYIIINKQENTGIGYARNASFRLSTGNIVAFLDDDDIWYPERLELMARYLPEHPEVDVLSHKVFKRYPDGSKKVLPTSIPKKDTFRSLLLKGNSLAISATVVRRDAFIKAGCFTEAFPGAEDYELWLRLSSLGCTFGFINEYLGEYTRRPGSFSLARIPIHLESVLGVLDKYSTVLINQNTEPSASIIKAIKKRKLSEKTSSIIKLLRRKDLKSVKKLFGGSNIMFFI
jgi:glycosyltransferase involved in cell wall biosynthesis